MARWGRQATEAWTIFNNTPAALTIRANTLKVTPDALASELRAAGVVTEPCAHARTGLVVLHGNPLATPLAHTGAFFVQDEASQLVAQFADPQPGDRVLDACAAPGGKTTAMAASMGDQGLVVACDVRDRRARLLQRTVRESGARIVRIALLDASRALPFNALFDRVLIDAPCSGLGTVRRDPDIKWRRTPADLPALADRQLQILRSCAEAVRPGGRLIYSTCSSEPEENEDVINSFLLQTSEFRPEGEALQTLPFRDGLEAFYARRLIRVNC
jgi:16S rRNA (cytosine967-C5)-methyltransferase